MDVFLIIIIGLFNNILIWYAFSCYLNKIKLLNKILTQKIIDLIKYKGLFSKNFLKQKIFNLTNLNDLLKKQLEANDIDVLEKSFQYFKGYCLLLFCIFVYMDTYTIMTFIHKFKKIFDSFF